MENQSDASNILLDGLKNIFLDNRIYPDEEQTDDKNYVTFFIEDGEEDLKCKFNIQDMNVFLNILCLLLSGSVTQDIIDLIFEQIDDQGLKSLFMSTLLKQSSNNLNSEKQKPAISASEFNI